MSDSNLSKKEKWIAELRELHLVGIQAHKDRDISFFTHNIAPDYFSVSHGEIRYPEKDAITEQFSDYLNNTTFSAYGDIREPIIKVSDDGTMGWVLVEVNVAGERKQAEGDSIRYDVIWAWITIYYRDNGVWIRQGEVSCARENTEKK